MRNGQWLEWRMDGRCDIQGRGKKSRCLLSESWNFPFQEKKEEGGKNSKLWAASSHYIADSCVKSQRVVYLYWFWLLCLIGLCNIYKKGKNVRYCFVAQQSRGEEWMCGKFFFWLRDGPKESSSDHHRYQIKGLEV